MTIKNTNADIDSDDVYVETDLVKLSNWKTQVLLDIASLNRRIPIRKKSKGDATTLQTVLEMQQVLLRQINQRMNEIKYGTCPDLYTFKRAAMELLSPQTLSEVEKKAKKYLYN